MNSEVSQLSQPGQTHRRPAAPSLTRVVPVAVLDRVEDAAPLADALVAGGLPCVEITLRTACALEAIGRLAGRTDIQVGAGTVTSGADVDRAVEAGAGFLVGPGFSGSVADRAAAQGIPYIPGVLTPTDILACLERDLTLLKLFPAAVAGGVALLRALEGPFGGVRFMPTGGITLAELPSYLACGNVAAVGGSWMVPRDIIAAGDFGAVETLVRETSSMIAEYSARGGKP